jgi:aldehyde:ferredoxin oxidoreductase
MAYGYAGMILRINLTNKKISKQPLPREWALRFIGGSGINDWILYNEVGPDADPIGPENKLIVGVGPFAGTIFPLGSKVRVTSRSPLTGMFGDGSAGGWFGPRLKYAGYDHIVVQGKADEPVYLWIDDEDVEIRNASHLWGSDVWETDDRIKEEVGDKEISTMAIGPGGENLVKHAVVVLDRHRTARCGMGCVMGSKKLKAIAVRGTGTIEIAKPEKFAEHCERVAELVDPRVNPMLGTLSLYGTMAAVPLYNEIGCHSVRNWQEVQWSEEKIKSVDPDRFLETFQTRALSCSNCIVHCSHRWEIKEGRFAGEYGLKIEYVPVCSFGMHLDNPNMESILYLQNLANKLGVDVIESGTSIGLLMECYEKGILPRKIATDSRFEWGDIDLIIDLVKKIAYREGIGDLLANGTLNAAKKIGNGAEKFVNHAKGMTMIEDVRAFPHWALAFAISTRGADHLKAYSFIDKTHRTDVSQWLFGSPKAGEPHTPELKAISVKFFEELYAIIDSLGFCKLSGTRLVVPKDPSKAMTPKDWAPIFSAATGIEIDPGEFVRCGERIVLLEKAFNARLGATRKDDTLGWRWMSEPCPSGPGKGMKCEDYLPKLLDEYYELRGFEIRTGLPTRSKLEELGLNAIADELERMGRLGKASARDG